MPLTRKHLLALSPFIVTGAMFMVAPWIAPTRFVCDRQAQPVGKCFVQNLIGITFWQVPSLYVQDAWMKTSGSGGKYSNRLIVKTTQGEIVFGDTRSNAPMYIAGQIQAFVQNPAQDSLAVVQDDRWDGFVWGNVFWLFGLIAFGLMQLFPEEG